MTLCLYVAFVDAGEHFFDPFENEMREKIGMLQKSQDIAERA